MLSPEAQKIRDLFIRTAERMNKRSRPLREKDIEDMNEIAETMAQVMAESGFGILPVNRDTALVVVEREETI